MLIKPPDGREHDLQALQALANPLGAADPARARILQEIRFIRAGLTGEAESGYAIDFLFKSSPNWAVIHDLRLECEGRVAQIDHLLINRLLDIYVCESKHFAEGVAINEHGEFTAFYEGRPRGIPSPLEQNKRHIAVLLDVLHKGQVPTPTRLGLHLKPRVTGLVLVSNRCRIQRPKVAIPGLEHVLKAEQLAEHIEANGKSDSAMSIVKLVSTETLSEFAQRLAAAHKPASFDWAAKFGIRPPRAPAPTPVQAPTVAPTPMPAQAPAPSPAVASAPDIQASKRAEAGATSKLICAGCQASVTYTVAKFCWSNKARFKGNVYCMACQRRH